MAGNVSVTFSAQIGELVDGVKGAKSAIESLGTSVNAAASGFKELAAVAGISLSIAGIKDFAESIAQLGAKIETVHEILGLSTTDVQKYGFVAKATGVDTDTFVQTIGRLQQNLERAQSGIGPTALALQALGLSAKELAALPVDQQILKLADAFDKYADGGKKAALANELVRNGAQTLLPAFDKGSEGIKTLTDAAVNAGTIMTSQTVQALAAVELKGITLKASLEALGGTLVADSTGLSTFSGYVTNAASKMTALASTGVLGEFVAKVMSAAWERLGRDVALAATLVSDFFTKAHFSDIAADYAAGIADVEAKDKEYGADLKVMIDNAVAGYKKLLAAQQGTADNRPQAPSSAQPNTGAMSAAFAAAQEQIKIADAVFKQTQEKLATEVKLHQITNDQETQLLLAALDARKAAEDAASDKEMSVYAKGTAGYQKALDERRTLDQQYIAARQKIVDQGVEADTKAWQNALQPIESSFNSQLRSLLSGTETWGQAMKKIMGDLVIAFIEGIEKIVVEWAAAQLAMAVGAPAAMLANVTRSIQANVGVVYAGEAANMALTLGPAAPAAAAGIASTVEATALGLSALDVGGNVQSSGLAIIHEGETVVPAQVNMPYSGGGGAGGGMGVNFNGIMIGTQAFFTQFAAQIARSQQAYASLNPSVAT